MRTDYLTKSLDDAKLCPKGHDSAACFYENKHLRYCLKCNVSWYIFYDTKLRQYERSKPKKGIVFP